MPVRIHGRSRPHRVAGYPCRTGWASRVLWRQPCTALGAAALENEAAGLGCHAGTKTVRAGARVSYVHSERFVSDMVKGLQHNRISEFKRAYRSLDALLIDDIQFFAGKERSQEEFFHTFNALYESHKQIIVTSDKFPKDIPGLEERLRSRFEWGLIADIQPPDVETKLAILKMKAEQNSIRLPEEVALFLANSVCRNVREMKGYLIRIVAFASLTSTPVSLEMARDVLKDILVERNKELTVEEIL